MEESIRDYFADVKGLLVTRHHIRVDVNEFLESLWSGAQQERRAFAQEGYRNLFMQIGEESLKGL
jgi:hypothetical protein